jgi:hypothetical protein
MFYALQVGAHPKTDYRRANNRRNNKRLKNGYLGLCIAATFRRRNKRKLYYIMNLCKLLYSLMAKPTR